MYFLSSLGVSVPAPPREGDSDDAARYEVECAAAATALHAAIADSQRHSPVVDQMEAEVAGAIRAAPRNRFMRDDPWLAYRIADAITHLDHQVDVGVVPVIRLRAAASDKSIAHPRNGQHPLISTVPVRYCNKCGDPHPTLVPFWVAFAQFVVQIELCGTCADVAITDHGATPQVAH
jgi:hypothetical protein